MKPAVTTIRAEREKLAQEALYQGSVVICASLFVALCARVSVPLPFTPVPLTLQNFGVLLVGLVLGPRRAFAALTLYLFEGASGLPVFNPMGPGGIAQLIGPTGGFLMSYPIVAAVAGMIAGEAKSFGRTVLASTISEALLFCGGVAWFSLIAHLPVSQALPYAAIPFCFAEVIKIMGASALAPRVRRLVR